MSQSTSQLTLGHPIFGSSELASLASSQGDIAAWQQLLTKENVASEINKVSGEFAVGLTSADGNAYLAVDRFAVCTLCYRVDQGELRFASRADDLSDAATEIDPQAIFDYLYFHVIPSPRTIFKGIYRLPPGHFAVFEKGVLTVKPYWVPVFPPSTEQPFHQLREQFLRLLEGAVAGQLDGSKPACFLSGGTDSSTVAGMIGAVSGQRASTYSIGFEAEGYDEMEYARIASRHFKTDHHEYYVTPDDLVQSVAEVAQYYDQPFGNSSALPSYYCARMAKADGVTRILAGDGGDELFGGNSRYAKQKLFNYYSFFPSALRARLFEPLFLRSGFGRLPLASKGASYIEQASTPMPDRNQMYNMLHRLGIDQILTPDFLNGINQRDPLDQQRVVWRAAKTNSETDRQLAFDWRYTLAECDLPKVIGTTGKAGVEVGFPMLDTRLLDFSMQLPVDYKLKGQRLRWFFKEALRGFLPDEILTKKKQGFGLPFGVWTTKHKPLRDLAEDSVRGLIDRGILRKEFVDTLFNKHLHTHPGYYGEMIWISMMLEQWLRGKENKLL